MIVIVAGPYVGFPNGTAPTSRVTAYAQGLRASGEDVRLILLGPSELDAETAVNTDVQGVQGGIPFEYTSVSTIKSPSLIARRWRALWSPLRARRRIRELAVQSRIDAVLLYSDVPYLAAVFERVSRAVGAVYAVDLCEMPHHRDTPGRSRDRRQERYGRRFIGRFDLVIAISRRLAAYAGRHLRPGAEVVLLPVMVDCDEYRPEERPVPGPRLVSYAGILNQDKDGVGSLVDAFSRVCREFPDVNLRLVGDSYDPVRASSIPEFRALAERFGVADRVEFVGLVPRRDIPRYLAEASVLVLARPSSEQAEAGLPTKIAEYLAAGRPVIVTRTSDISEYLQDAESAYLVAPGDVDALAEKLRQVLRDPEDAQRVARAGRRVAEQRFDYRVTGRELAEALGRLRVREPVSG